MLANTVRTENDFLFRTLKCTTLTTAMQLSSPKFEIITSWTLWDKPKGIDTGDGQGPKGSWTKAEEMFAVGHV
jgi:hypothetical protein